MSTSQAFPSLKNTIIMIQALTIHGSLHLQIIQCRAVKEVFILETPTFLIFNLIPDFKRKSYSDLVYLEKSLTGNQVCVCVVVIWAETIINPLLARYMALATKGVFFKMLFSR